MAETTREGEAVVSYVYCAKCGARTKPRKARGAQTFRYPYPHYARDGNGRRCNGHRLIALDIDGNEVTSATGDTTP